MKILTVSALTTHIVALVERDELLRDIQVTGELSNLKRAVSGHLYFNLKDSGASVAAVMWRGQAGTLGWLPKEGDQVVAHGYVGIYPERGAYQLYVNQMRPAGRGQFYEKFEQLKQRLATEGLFASERKRPIPFQPRSIGIVTSADAAALRDILRVLSGRWPMMQVVLFATLVQGEEAPNQIVAALQAANRYSQQVEELQVILLARGGGSIEDLWAFNDERVAYAVAVSELPVVVGVGHETDFTIVDFVADLRAPTPSAAAMAVSPDWQEVLSQLQGTLHNLGRSAFDRIARERQLIIQAEQRLRRVHPSRQMDISRQSLDERERRLRTVVDFRLQQYKVRGNALVAQLAALSPEHVLRRGYSIVQQADGRVVTSIQEVQLGDELSVRVTDGSFAAVVIKGETTPLPDPN
jgi:exodeoxyribonuclease VII large subunit